MSDTFLAYILSHCRCIVNEKSVLNIKKSVLDIDEQLNGRYNNYVKNKFSWEEIMFKTKRHIAIMSLLVCLMASFTLSFSFGNTSKANAEGETAYKLSFLGEPTNMVKDGWADGYATIADDVATISFASGTDGYSPEILLKSGSTYIIKMDIRTDAEGGTGCWVYADSNKTDQTWDCIFKGGVVTGNATIDADGVITGINADWSTVSIVYTPTANIAYLRFTDWAKKGFQLKDFTITEKLADDITVTAGAAIGNLPPVPEKEGYVGHWEIDKKAISSATVYDFDADKIATPAYGKAYTLSFYGEPTNMVKDGWADGYATIADDIATISFASGTDGYSPAVSMKAGTTYIISMDIRTDAEGGTGCWVYADRNKTDQTWTCIFKGGVVTGNATIDADGVITGVNADWSTVSINYTPTENISYLRFTDWAQKGFQLKNFTVTEIIETRVFTVAGEIGELPAIPEKTGYIGRWVIDGEEITAETNFAATENKAATAVYEKAYTLSYEALPETNMIKDGWSVENTIENNIMTVNLTAETRTPSVTLFAGVTYRITFDHQKVAGEKGYTTFHLFDGNWSAIKTAIVATDTKQTLKIEYTPTKASSNLIFQWAEGDKGVKLSNFTVYGYAKVQTLKAGEAVGSVPTIACGTNYRAYWKIGDVEVTADTTISQDEIANLVIEYNGHVFKGSEFAFVEAKDTTKPGENTATYAIKYVGTEEVGSWSDKTWATGQFATQAFTLKVKKAAGTEATIESSQMQLNEGVLWFTFTTKVFGDIAEITIPAGEYKLTDGTGFKLEEITFYMVHYNCGLNEKVDYTVEHVAEVKETCTTDGCLDYYYCAKCGRYFEDEDCTTEIEDIDEWKADENGGLLEKTGHDFKKEWSFDETEHWHECRDCGEKTAKAAHADDNKDNKCDVCGEKFGSDESSSTAEDGGESGCLSDISMLSPYLVIMLCAALCIIILRKRQSNR